MRIYSILFLTILFISCNSRPTPAEQPTPFVPFSTEELKQRTFQYFWELTDSTTQWQTPDRWPSRTFSSIAATGFGITSFLIGIENEYVSRQAAAERVLHVLEVLYHLPQGAAQTGMGGYKGFFYHFLTYEKGTRFKEVELSTIDTGLLMAGILSAQTYFSKDNPTEKKIRELADNLYRRVEWDWFLNEEGRLSMGWHPERGFIEADWRGYNEAMILILLAMGSPTHPIPANSWELWCEPYEWMDFYGMEHVNFDPLFGHQYSHMYVDFRGIQDAYMREKGIDYFENARRATLANRAYCIDNPSGFTGYGPNQWGLTACDGPANDRIQVQGKPIQTFTYRARGASAQRIVDDGTIAPTAAGGSIPFASEASLAALEYMWNTHADQLIGKYGFRDAFNLTYTKGNPSGWFDTDYLGIDQGPILIQLQNHENEMIWNLMKQNPYLISGLKKAGFTGGWLGEM